jgi:two-component system, cell cycle sensor histidine kinase and response regulator CckA
VDDEPSVLAVTSRILHQHGYPTMEAGTGDEALILAATYDFQLLLTDSVMPGMNGPTLAERVAALRPGLPIIRMSGSDDTARARPHYTPGSEQAYIQKPFTASDLIGQVRAALAAAAGRPPGPASRLTAQPTWKRRYCAQYVDFGDGMSLWRFAARAARAVV